MKCQRQHGSAAALQVRWAGAEKEDRGGRQLSRKLTKLLTVLARGIRDVNKK
jgi:hypothetical protein